MKTINVKLEDLGKEIEITKLPLGRYAELLKSLKQLPTQFEGLTKLSQDDFLVKLPFLIGEAWPDFIEILRIGTNLSKEEIELISLDEAVDCVVAIIELNKYAKVWERIKKGIAEFQRKPEIMKSAG